MNTQIIRYEFCLCDFREYYNSHHLALWLSIKNWINVIINENLKKDPKIFSSIYSILDLCFMTLPCSLLQVLGPLGIPQHSSKILHQGLCIIHCSHCLQCFALDICMPYSLTFTQISVQMLPPCRTSLITPCKIPPSCHLKNPFNLLYFFLQGIYHCLTICHRLTLLFVSPK